ncbi:phage head completion protein [Actinomadura nitritigenes]|uniref:phage head completion protein n=1 Tax=Actinomadura nitritigenes TaxID=134602 RepID=UPI003D9457E5
MLPIVTDLVTIVRPLLVTGYGNAVTYGWGPDASRTTVEACVEPNGTGEATGGRDTVTVHIRVFLHPGTEVKATDRIEWNGRTYEIDGEPQRWPDPTGGGEHHVELTATYTAGG